MPRTGTGTSAPVLWFTGLSGSGKSTIATRVHQELVRRGMDVEYIDGDALREVFPQHRVHPGGAGGAPAPDRLHGEPARGARRDGGRVVRLALPGVARLHPAALSRASSRSTWRRRSTSASGGT